MPQIYDQVPDQIEWEKFCLIADKIEADPSLLDRPISILDGWLARSQRHTPSLEDWKTKLEAAKLSKEAMASLCHQLRSSDITQIELNERSPIGFVLTRAEHDLWPYECRHNFIWVDEEPDTSIPFEQRKRIGPVV